MKLGFVLGLMGCLACGAPAARAQFGGRQPANDAAARTQSVVIPADIVFCVDNSGSMAQYLDQTKDLIRALTTNLSNQEGAIRLDLRVGVIQYGAADNDYRVLPLTRDANALLQTVRDMNADIGAEEWVGRAVELAQQKMDWRAGDSFRAIYVLGNETAEQGPLSYRQSVRDAVNNGIAVNAVQYEPVDPDSFEADDFSLQSPFGLSGRSWQDLAAVGQGQYFHFRFQSDTPFDILRQAAYSISTDETQNRALKERHIDQWINGRLSEGLRLLEQNRLPFNQNNALAHQGYKIMLQVNESLGGTLPRYATVNDLERDLQAAFSAESNSDLVGMSLRQGFDLSNVPEQWLPFNMRMMSLVERQNYLRDMGERRQQILGQLANLQTQRLLLKR